MGAIIKNFDDLAKIKEAIKIWKKVKINLENKADVGVSLIELDLLAREKIIEYGGFPTFYKKYNFPGNICISVNECVIHGVPTDYKLKAGDKVTFDVGVTYQDHVCDAAFTLVIGHNETANKISCVCKNAINEVAKIIKPGITNIEIGAFIQSYVESNGYYVLRDFTGHGCGNELHEDPIIPNYKSDDFEVVKLEKNMVICIEPMIMTASNEYYINPLNGWDVIAQNKELTCHWEDMILITQDGCEILTGEN